ncbi:MAG: hypothetical protein EOM50_04200 [Erysipelotrichia bacterium]|nr:hypothetical protein [Erysipelotrichia bacterium]NCC54487.1 hypothetical protein [Erysipelotrichia bacterium]
MIYVYVDSLRMAYIQKALNAHTLSDPDEIKANDIIIFPVLKKTQHTIMLKKGILHLSAIEQCTLFLPFAYSFFKENNKVYYYMRDDTLVKKNALLTASGLMAYLGSLPIDLNHTTFDVIGYGKCGKAIIDLFTAIGVAYRCIRHEHVEKAKNQYT